jgi:hypothetical protein
MIMTRRILSSRVLALLLGLGLPATVSAQVQGQDRACNCAAGKDLSLTAEQRQAYIGTYATELPTGEKVIVRIFEEKGVLRLRSSDVDESRRLLYQGENVFLAENTAGFMFTFVVVNNRATTFQMHRADGDLTAVRVSDTSTGS